MKAKVIHVIKSTLLGVILFGLSMFIVGFILENGFKGGHPHGFSGLWTLIQVLIFIPIGAIIGLITALLVENFKKVILILLIGLVITFAGFTLFYYVL